MSDLKKGTPVRVVATLPWGESLDCPRPGGVVYATGTRGWVTGWEQFHLPGANEWDRWSLRPEEYELIEEDA